MIPNEELDTLVSCSKSKKVFNKPILLEAIDYSSHIFTKPKSPFT